MSRPVGFHPGERAADLTRDRRLAAQVVAGDEAAFEEMVKGQQAHVARIAGRFFRRPEVVEDVLQEVFLKAYTAMADYRGEMPLQHWLSRITVNACYDHLRRKQSRPETLVSQITEDASGFFERLAAPEGSASASYWEREDARLLAEQLLALLSPPERLVLTLMVLEELSAAQVAKVTGWSVPNVKIRAFRARARVRKLLAEGSARARSREVSS